MKNKMKMKPWTSFLQRVVIICIDKPSLLHQVNSRSHSLPPKEFPADLKSLICPLCLTEMKWKMEQKLFCQFLNPKKGKTSEFDQNN